MECKGKQCEYFNSRLKYKCSLQGEKVTPDVTDCNAEEYVLIEIGMLEEELSYIRGYLQGL